MFPAASGAGNRVVARAVTGPIVYGENGIACNVLDAGRRDPPGFHDADHRPRALRVRDRRFNSKLRNLQIQELPMRVSELSQTQCSAQCEQASRSSPGGRRERNDRRAFFSLNRSIAGLFSRRAVGSRRGWGKCNCGGFVQWGSSKIKRRGIARGLIGAHRFHWIDIHGRNRRGVLRGAGGQEAEQNSCRHRQQSETNTH